MSEDTLAKALAKAVRAADHDARPLARLADRLRLRGWRYVELRDRALSADPSLSVAAFDEAMFAADALPPEEI
jgi:hypothetical protein